MATIILCTDINASAQKCFDLSRAVDIHLQSTRHTSERVVAGRSSGLFELGDVVTWEAKHFGIKQRLTVKITKMEAPHFFEDVMQKGAFKSMRHEHHFEEKGGKTIMKDVFCYETPLGIAGNIFDALVLKRYMTRFLILRNEVIKKVAENGTL
ncbi:MAG TPA: SRPBCC family protein [Flavipsychrobacter sp.]|nr:SRPBCC family protein [Flavipsychrobacter sp.]